MTRNKKITLPIIIDHADFNTKVILGKPPLALLSFLFVVIIAIFFYTQKDSSLSNFEYLELVLFIILFTILPAIAMLTVGYVLFLNYVFVGEQYVKYTKPTGFPKKKVRIKKSDIKKLAVIKRITTYKNTGGDPYKLVGTFMKLVIIDKKNNHHQLTPEVYRNDGKFPKTWSDFLTKLSKATGLRIDEYVETT